MHTPGQKYWAAVDAHGTVFGVGVSKEDALADAFRYKAGHLDTRECSEKAFNELYDNGYTHGRFTTAGGVICLQEEAS